MKKDKVTHLSPDPQQLSFTTLSTAKLPLESDPVLKKKFESALKSAGSATNIFPLPTDKKLLDPNYPLDASHNPLTGHPFSATDDHLFGHGVKKKSTAMQNKTHHKLSTTPDKTTENSPQPDDNTPGAIIANMAVITANNTKLTTLSTTKHKQPIRHLVNSLTDKSQQNEQAKTLRLANELTANKTKNQSIKPAKPIIISPDGEQTTITYQANYPSKKISSASNPHKHADPMDTISQPEKKPRAADKEKRQENSIDPPSFPAALSAAITTEKMLATTDSEKTSASLLNTLFNKLNAVLNVDINKIYQPPIIQLNLPQIGHLQIKIQQEQQNIMIEFVAQAMGQKILLEHRQDLIEKLQRIHPDQHIQLVILNDQQSRERSKDQQHQPDDYEEEMV